MLTPLRILAVLSIIGGLVGWPYLLLGSNRLERFLEPVFQNPLALEARAYSHGLQFGLMALSVAVAVLGIYIAYQMYQKQPGLPERVAAAVGSGYRLLLNKYYVDELYDALFVNRAKDLGDAAAAFDLVVVDGGVNGVGWTTRVSAELSRLWDLWVIDGLVNVMAFGVKVLSYPMRVLQTGLVQNYAMFIVLGVVALLAYYFVLF
jgi:NADH-quinone oxidoreductase subunit L